ncbi:Maf family protein [Alkalimarinus alittae]|uniref:7-methyl-GTP pyrophosphatase n=1 Tax=Alkalimarinus alittae TaxID=2961619 RepID=A0ABY6MXZ5_9ALTE|nr:nucleoside triphosphate pyrophosphatase [Alkalimarinus alittae]UZE94700.1 Maf family nucleotide pyrophosphatase [Alkalimarinus alittae]
MSDLPLVLASSSPYRSAILEKINLPFISVSPNINESAHNNESPEALVARVTQEKAFAIQSNFPNHLIISSDQIATLSDGTILTKPHTHDNAIKQLQACNGKRVTFLTGLSLLNTATHNHQLIIEPFDVTFRTLSNDEIDNYLRLEQPYDCAGSFKVEGLGICLFESLTGNDINALVGLPLIKLLELLRNESVNPLSKRNN